MGIYIKGMEMPQSCYDCSFQHPCKHDEDKDYCVVIDDFLYCYNMEANNCPLVPVPPHGDLIDREYAIASACSGRIRALPTTEDGEDWIRVEEVRESIKSAPTVIPADKDGET